MNKIVLKIVVGLVVVIIAGILIWENKHDENIEQGLTRKNQNQSEVNEMNSLSYEEKINLIRDKKYNQSDLEKTIQLIGGQYEYSEVNFSNWKDYRNDKVGFELKIPNEWQCQESNDNENTQSVACMPKKYWEENNNDDLNARFIISRYAESSIRNEEMGETNIKDVKLILVDDRYALTYDWNDEHRSVLFSEREEFWLIFNNHKSGFNKDIFDGIIQSFQIIE